MDWEKYFNMLYQSRGATDVAAAALKAVNILGEAGVPGVKGLMESVDKKAYLIASMNQGPVRDEIDIKSALSGETDDYYRGIFETNELKNKFSDKTQPNLLKMFLGMEENILPESEYKPTSWTKGDPEQGWRSMKEYASLDIESPEMYEFLIKNKNAMERDMSIKKFVDENYGDVGERVNLMRSAVASGEYTPEMAVKGSFPGLSYSTDVNVGHMTKSIGYDTDKKQYYMSASDVWDFEPEQYAEIWGDVGSTTTRGTSEKMYTQAALMQSAGKPIGLYDRYYLPEDYMKNWFGELEKPSTEKKLISKFNKEDIEIF